MANTAFVRTNTTGGAGTDLDGIATTDLNDDDICFVRKNNVAYEYQYQSTSASSEITPSVIKPDDNGGNGRWKLQRQYGGLFIDQTANLEVGITTDIETVSSATSITLNMAGEFMKTFSPTTNFDLEIPSGGNGECDVYLTPSTSMSINLASNVSLTHGSVLSLTNGKKYLMTVRRFSTANAVVSVAQTT